MLAAAGIAIATAVAHVFAGQAHIARVLVAELESIDLAVMLAVWHMVSVVLFASGLGLGALAMSAATEATRPLALALAFVFGLFGALFVFVSIVYGVLALQWIAMLLVSILAALGARRRTS